MTETPAQSDTPIPPGLYAIPAGRAFAGQLAEGLMTMAGGDPMRLADMTLLLPTRRACRTMREAFLALSDGKPLLLPRMRPLSDADPDELAITLAADTGEGIAEALLDIPPAISLLRRRLVLARLIRKLPITKDASADQAVGLAAELAKLLDEIQTEGLSFDRLHDLVPENHSEHWQITIDFLKILSEHWPDMLDEEGVIDPADRRNRVLAAQAETWRRHPPQHPVIAAGSTGTIPAAADLLRVVAGLPQGYVVLPGLDTDMDADSWQQMGPTHPQYGLRQLLEGEKHGLRTTRDAVTPWPVAPRHDRDEPADKLERRRLARVKMWREAMRPAGTSEKWQALENTIPEAALDGLQRVDCANPQEEADVIALMMRQTLETPGRTAALVTPDRFLARRVAMSLRRWGVEVDDSGGQSLPLSRAGGWLRLVARALLEDLAPVALLACLKHPLAACGMAPADFSRSVDLLEEKILRGLRPGPGFKGLRDAVNDLRTSKDKRKSLTDAQYRALTDFIDRLEDCMAPLRDLFAGDPVRVEDMLQAHLRVVEAMAATDAKAGAPRIWRHEDGEAAAAFAAELETAASGLPPVDAAEYCGLVDGLMRGVMVRPRYGFHPRLTILGMLEARLFQADLMILGGLNEGTWPPDPGADPWMSRPMRKEFELPSPDFAVGLTAHDFVQCACAPEVVLTRAEREGGAPSVPSRWLDRLETVLQGAGLKDALPATPWQGWARQLDKADTVAPCPRPEPRPPAEHRRRRLSVTRIGTWMRDPYQVYARDILRLYPLDAIDAEPGAAERGTFMHDALARFVADYPDALPDQPLKKLKEYGVEAFGALLDNPEVYSFWWPRFERMAREFLKFEQDWRSRAKPGAQELTGEISVPVSTGDDFTLYGIADRIDRMNDGAVAIIDYKTGTVPKDQDIIDGLEPQLPLEAFIAEGGGFPGIEAAQVGYIGHWQVSGGATPFLEKPVKEGRDIADAHALAEAAREGLVALVEKFDDPATPYPPVPRPEHAPRYNDYEHLARIAEWAVAGGDGGEA